MAANAARKLGVRLPSKVEDKGRFKELTYPDGKKKFAVRLKLNYDKSKDATPPPAFIDWSPKALSALARMYRNNVLGCCVISDTFHTVGVMTGNEEDVAVQGTDAEVDTAYTTICGPGDQGCVITDVLDYHKAKGIKINGTVDKIDDYVSVDHTDINLVKVAIDMFGCLKPGINLPQAWYDSFGPGATWDVTDTEIIGGHDVCVYGYNDKGILIGTWGTAGTLVTWAALTSGTWFTELYAALAPDWYNADDLAPNGIDVATLKADLAAIANGQTPPLGPPAPVPLPPGPTPTPPGPTPTPVPNPPVPTQPSFALSGTIAMPNHRDSGTFEGIATPMTAGGPTEKLARPEAVNWQQIIAIIIAILQALQVPPAAIHEIVAKLKK